jgi:hypothetical protein
LSERSTSGGRVDRLETATDPVPGGQVLAEPYALMILNGATQIDAAHLSDTQRAALDGAFRNNASSTRTASALAGHREGDWYAGTVGDHLQDTDWIRCRDHRRKQLRRSLDPCRVAFGSQLVEVERVA